MIKTVERAHFLNQSTDRAGTKKFALFRKGDLKMVALSPVQVLCTSEPNQVLTAKDSSYKDKCYGIKIHIRLL